LHRRLKNRIYDFGLLDTAHGILTSGAESWKQLYMQHDDDNEQEGEYLLTVI